MFIVFGSKMVGRKKHVRSWGRCHKCGTYGKQRHYTARKWGHIYYIPILPSGSQVRVINECRKCRNGIHITAADVPRTLEGAVRRSNAAINALVTGQERYDDAGMQEPCIPTLTGVARTFHALAEPAYTQWLLTTLREEDLPLAHAIVQGQILELNGDLDQAETMYKQAVTDHPDSEFARRSLASAYIHGGDKAKARDTLDTVLEMCKTPEDKVAILRILIGLNEDMKDYSEACKCYDECFELSPRLTGEKKFAKAYRKACKKAKREASPYH